MNRSDEEIRDFVDECVRIEKENGNVQEYVGKEWPSYSPRATWIMLQKEYLHRSEKQLTSGMPKDTSKRITVGGKLTWPAPRKPSKPERAALALAAGAAEGKNRTEVLQALGYKNISSTMSIVRSWVKDHRPELMEIINAMPNSSSPRCRPYKERPSAQGSRKAKAEVPEAEDPEKEAMAKMTDGVPETGGASPCCCQTAPSSRVSVPDEIPDFRPMYPIRREEMVFSRQRIVSRLGTWEYSAMWDMYIFQPSLKADADPEIGMMLAMGRDDWLDFAAEIPEAIRSFD